MVAYSLFIQFIFSFLQSANLKIFLRGIYFEYQYICIWLIHSSQLALIIELHHFGELDDEREREKKVEETTVVQLKNCLYLKVICYMLYVKFILYKTLFINIITILRRVQRTGKSLLLSQVLHHQGAQRSQLDLLELGQITKSSKKMQ